MKLIINKLSQLFHIRKSILELSLYEFNSNYTGSLLGGFWHIIQSVTFVLIYWFIFMVVWYQGGGAERIQI